MRYALLPLLLLFISCYTSSPTSNNPYLPADTTSVVDTTPRVDTTPIIDTIVMIDTTPTTPPLSLINEWCYVESNNNLIFIEIDTISYKQSFRIPYDRTKYVVEEGVWSHEDNNLLLFSQPSGEEETIFYELDLSDSTLTFYYSDKTITLSLAK